ncbi:MAG: CheR family methyltransferase [Alphaproteobacteria bacterium]|nr:CheR family methyltransferase [Alphaproteobacteria bacterium]
MKPEDFDLFAQLVKHRSGLVLTREKAYLLESRLLPVVRKYNLKALEDMAQAVRANRQEDMLRDITEALVTNDSSFFRDWRPFIHFQKTILPRMHSARAAKKHLRIWSAGASSGQEAYSLAMICAEEAAALRGWRVDIIGTEISRDMIERAQGGIYTQFEVQRGLPITMLVKYFEQMPGDKWQIKEDIRQMAQFREGNLLQDFGPIGTFDIIFCRNVLAYFDAPTQAKVLDALGGVMAPDGVLFLGAAESISSVDAKFRPMGGLQGIFTLAAAQEKQAV